MRRQMLSTWDVESGVLEVPDDIVEAGGRGEMFVYSV